MIWVFLGLCLLPVFVVFASPFVFYHLPIDVRIGPTVVELDIVDILRATAVWVIWVMIIACSVLIGRTRRVQRPLCFLPLSGSHVWWCFLACSTVGVIIAVLHQLLVMPSVIENLVHVLALSPTLGILFGLALIKQGQVTNHQKIVIVMLTLLCAVASLVLPLILGFVNPIAISVLGVLYGIYAITRSWKVLSWWIVGFGCVVFLGLAIKTDIRERFYNGTFERSLMVLQWLGDSAAPSRDASADREESNRFPWSFDERVSHILAALRKTDRTSQPAAFQETQRCVPSFRSQRNPAISSLDIHRSRSMGSSAKNQDSREIIAWCREAAEAGDVWAMLGLAGHLLQENPKEAVPWLERAANKGNREAMEILSLMYEWGQGVQQEYRAALQWEIRRLGSAIEPVRDALLDRLHDGELGAAMHMLGTMYEGNGRIDKDLTRAARWFWRGALSGNVVCMTKLGRLYALGEGVPRNFIQARYWYEQAARARDAQAMLALARLYERGLGGARDLTKAAEWRQQAKALGLDDDRHEEHRQSFDPISAFADHDPNYFRLRWLDRDRHPYWYYCLARVAHRLNSLGNLAYAVKVTPSVVPHSYFETYKPLAYFGIPRLVWPEKPSEIAGQLIGVRYGLQKPSDPPFAWSMPTVFESWMAGGWIGVCLTAAVLGGLLRLAWITLVGEDAGLGNTILGAVIVMAMAHVAMSSLNLVIGGMLHHLLVYGGLLGLPRIVASYRAAPSTMPENTRRCE